LISFDENLTRDFLKRGDLRCHPPADGHPNQIKEDLICSSIEKGNIRIIKILFKKIEFNFSISLDIQKFGIENSSSIFFGHVLQLIFSFFSCCLSV
jgi:hypothetical protein